jgi:hypothetical protein
MPQFRVTPIFVLLTVGILICIPLTFYYLYINNNGGMALAGVLAGMNSMVMIVLLIAERMIVKRVRGNTRKVWIVELLIIAVVSIMFLFSQRSYYFKVNDDVQWFCIVPNGKIIDREAAYSFPNNNVLSIEKDEVVFISDQEIENRTRDIKSTGKIWRGYIASFGKIEINDAELNYVIYQPQENNFSSDSIQKIIEPAIRTKAANIGL